MSPLAFKNEGEATYYIYYSGVFQGSADTMVRPGDELIIEDGEQALAHVAWGLMQDKEPKQRVIAGLRDGGLYEGSTIATDSGPQHDSTIGAVLTPTRS